MFNYLLLASALGVVLSIPGASGSPHTLLGNFEIEAVRPSISSKLTVEYPDGFGAMRLSDGEVMTEDMVKKIRSEYLKNPTTPSDATFQTNVLNSDFSFNTTVVNADTFKFPLRVYKNNAPTSKAVDFQAALLKTSFTDDRLSGRTAILTFDVPSYNRRGDKSLFINRKITNVAVVLAKNNDSTKKLAFYFRMLCAKHPTQSDGTKGTSVPCTSSEFRPYSTTAKAGSSINKYKMSLLGSRGNYYHNTIAFVPYAVLGGRATPGTYTGNLTVTFGVR